MHRERTPRGFQRREWADLNGEACSIQESSLATECAIWLGCASGTHVDGACLARMHLSRVMVKELLPLLQHFAETGRLPE